MEIEKMQKKAWHMEEFHDTADKTFQKSRKQVNFSTIEDKNKKGKQERYRG